jgi:predicted transcriptional regulator
MRVVIEADEQYRNMFLEIANSIKAKISFTDEEDFYDSLPEHVINGVEESREEISRGEFLTHEEIMKKYLAKYQ